MGRVRKLAKLDAASTAVDNTALIETTNASLVVGSRVTRGSKLRAEKNLPESSSNPSENEEQLLDNLSLVQKIDFLVNSVKEGIKLLNEDKAKEVISESQYLEYQKKVDSLTKENHDLSEKLASALSKLEAYENMNGLGQMKEMMNASNMTKATEAFIKWPRWFQDGALPAIAAVTNDSLLQGATGEGTNPDDNAELNASLPQEQGVKVPLLLPLYHKLRRVAKAPLVQSVLNRSWGPSKV